MEACFAGEEHFNTGLWLRWHSKSKINYLLGGKHGYNSCITSFDLHELFSNGWGVQIHQRNDLQNVDPVT
jgi:hypothetical protein